jgi:hypothetical protein
LNRYQLLGSRTGTADECSRSLQDDDIRNAINALKVSTAAIEKHSRVLESQKAALQELTEQHGKGANASDDVDIRLRGKRLHESTRLGFSVGLPSMISKIEQATNN